MVKNIPITITPEFSKHSSYIDVEKLNSIHQEKTGRNLSEKEIQSIVEFLKNDYEIPTYQFDEILDVGISKTYGFIDELYDILEMDVLSLLQEVK